jgi:hypothetical protein
VTWPSIAWFDKLTTNGSKLTEKGSERTIAREIDGLGPRSSVRSEPVEGRAP